MTVRAKLTLTAVTEYQDGSKVLKFSCSYDPTIPEDQRFQKATPWGEFEMRVDNPAAIEQFTLGAAYHVDFNPVVKQEAA